MDQYYYFLGVSTTASIEEIKKSYKLRAQVCHPDHLQGKVVAVRKAAEEMMKQLSEARDQALRLLAASDLENASSEATPETGQANSADSADGGQVPRIVRLSAADLADLHHSVGRFPSRIRVKVNGPPLGPNGHPISGRVLDQILKVVKEVLPRGGRILVDTKGVVRLSDRQRIVSFGV